MFSRDVLLAGTTMMGGPSCRLAKNPKYLNHFLSCKVRASLKRGQQWAMEGALRNPRANPEVSSMFWVGKYELLTFSTSRKFLTSWIFFTSWRFLISWKLLVLGNHQLLGNYIQGSAPCRRTLSCRLHGIWLWRCGWLAGFLAGLLSRACKP